jgi:hypothetical protein
LELFVQTPTHAKSAIFAKALALMPGRPATGRLFAGRVPRLLRILTFHEIFLWFQIAR